MLLLTSLVFRSPLSTTGELTVGTRCEGLGMNPFTGHQATNTSPAVGTGSQETRLAFCTVHGSNLNERNDFNVKKWCIIYELCQATVVVFLQPSPRLLTHQAIRRYPWEQLLPSLAKLALQPSCTHSRLKPHPLSNELAIVTALGQWSPLQSEKIASLPEMEALHGQKTVF